MRKPEHQDWRDSLPFKNNPIIRTLTISDVFILSGLGLINPIFAVFVTNHIQGGNLAVVGIATTIYFLTKSIGQLPASHLIDRIKGEQDDFWALVGGATINCLVPLLYLVVRTPEQIYLIQFLHGLGQAFAFPAWLAIFTRHVDHTRAGSGWGFYYTLTDLSVAATAAIGGFVAYRFGFTPLFLGVFALSVIGSAWLLAIRRDLNRGGETSSQSN